MDWLTFGFHANFGFGFPQTFYGLLPPQLDPQIIRANNTS